MPDSEVREHRWSSPGAPADNIWIYRDCPICGLEDQRMQLDADKNSSNAKWQVTTPCIEPVPKTMSWEDLKADLMANGVELKNYPLYIEGNPDRWYVGVRIYSSQSIRFDPCIEIKPPMTLEHGYALVLRWFRAREYKPWAHPYYKSVSSTPREASTSHCCDDD